MNKYNNKNFHSQIQLCNFYSFMDVIIVSSKSMTKRFFLIVNCELWMIGWEKIMHSHQLVKVITISIQWTMNDDQKEHLRPMNLRLGLNWYSLHTKNYNIVIKIIYEYSVVRSEDNNLIHRFHPSKSVMQFNLFDEKWKCSFFAAELYYY